MSIISIITIPFKEEDDEASATLSFFSTTRTEALSPNLLDLEIINRDNCKLKIKDKDSQPTHVVASVTYGGDCHFNFEHVRLSKSISISKPSLIRN